MEKIVISEESEPPSLVKVRNVLVNAFVFCFGYYDRSVDSPLHAKFDIAKGVFDSRAFGFNRHYQPFGSSGNNNP